MLTLVSATTPAHIEDARRLFLEYSAALNIDLQFQNFEEELKGLPGKYAEPEGILILAYSNGNLAGCVGLRPILVADYPNACEMKRLYVRSKYRNEKIGYQLVDSLIKAAKLKNYQYILLDTLPFLTKAQELYQKFGFVKVSPYCDAPLEGMTFFRLVLG
jgi:putative acetyltransferase